MTPSPTHLALVFDARNEASDYVAAGRLLTWLERSGVRHGDFGPDAAMLARVRRHTVDVSVPPGGFIHVRRVMGLRTSVSLADRGEIDSLRQRLADQPLTCQFVLRLDMRTGDATDLHRLLLLKTAHDTVAPSDRGESVVGPARATVVQAVVRCPDESSAHRADAFLWHWKVRADQSRDIVVDYRVGGRRPLVGGEAGAAPGGDGIEPGSENSSDDDWAQSPAFTSTFGKVFPVLTFGADDRGQVDKPGQTVVTSPQDRSFLRAGGALGDRSEAAGLGEVVPTHSGGRGNPSAEAEFRKTVSDSGIRWARLDERPSAQPRTLADLVDRLARDQLVGGNSGDSVAVRGPRRGRTPAAPGSHSRDSVAVRLVRDMLSRPSGAPGAAAGTGPVAPAGEAPSGPTLFDHIFGGRSLLSLFLFLVSFEESAVSLSGLGSIMQWLESNWTASAGRVRQADVAKVILGQTSLTSEDGRKIGKATVQALRALGWWAGEADPASGDEIWRALVSAEDLSQRLQGHVETLGRIADAVLNLTSNVVKHAALHRGVMFVRTRESGPPDSSSADRKWLVEHLGADRIRDRTSYVEVTVADYSPRALNLAATFREHELADAMRRENEWRRDRRQEGFPDSLRQAMKGFEGLQPADFVSNEPLAEEIRRAWVAYFMLSESAGKHLGLRVFRQAVDDLGGGFHVESHGPATSGGCSYSSPGWRGAADDSPCLPGTAYSVVVPLTPSTGGYRRAVGVSPEPSRSRHTADVAAGLLTVEPRGDLTADALTVLTGHDEDGLVWSDLARVFLDALMPSQALRPDVRAAGASVGSQADGAGDQLWPSPDIWVLDVARLGPPARAGEACFKALMAAAQLVRRELSGKQPGMRPSDGEGNPTTSVVFHSCPKDFQDRFTDLMKEYLRRVEALDEAIVAPSPFRWVLFGADEGRDGEDSWDKTSLFAHDDLPLSLRLNGEWRRQRGVVTPKAAGGRGSERSWLFDQDEQLVQAVRPGRWPALDLAPEPLPYELLIRYPRPSDQPRGPALTPFEHHVEAVLCRPFGGPRQGCRISEAHTRLGSTIHVPWFYDAETLLTSPVYAHHFAFLLTRDLFLRHAADITGVAEPDEPLRGGARPGVDDGRPPREPRLFLFGYAEYSQTLLLEAQAMIEAEAHGQGTGLLGGAVYRLLYLRGAQAERFAPETIRALDIDKNGQPARPTPGDTVIVVVPLGSTMKTTLKMRAKLIEKYAPELTVKNTSEPSDQLGFAGPSYSVVSLGSTAESDNENNPFWTRPEGPMSRCLRVGVSDEHRAGDRIEGGSETEITRALVAGSSAARQRHDGKEAGASFLPGLELSAGESPR